MGMFTACFDASGSEDDPRTPFLTVAGFISTTDDWVDFSALWDERLGKDKIAYFRMSEFAHSEGEFKGWKNQEDRRRSLLTDLFNLIKSHAFRKFGCTVRISALKEMNKDLRAQFYLTAYVLAGRHCAGDVLQWMIGEGQGLHTTPLALIFEEGDAGQSELRRRLEEDGFPVNFRPKKDTTRETGMVEPGFVPLQAADILAYEMSLSTRRVNFDRWPTQELLSMPGRIGIYDEEDIPALEKDLRVLGAGHHDD